MDVWMIWVTDEQDPAGTIWLEEAWDDDVVGGNPNGWAQKVSELAAEYGGQNIRIIKTSVNFDKIKAAFEPTEA